MDGLNCFGCDDASVGFDWKSFGKSAGGQVLQAAGSEIQKADDKKPDASKPSGDAASTKGGGGSHHVADEGMSTGMKVGIAAGVVAGAGVLAIAVKKLFFR